MSHIGKLFYIGAECFAMRAKLRGAAGGVLCVYERRDLAMPPKTENIEAVTKTLRIMEILADHGGDLTVTQISKMLGSSVSSVDRYLHTLQSAGYVVKNTYTNRYELSLSLYALGGRYVKNNYMVKALINAANAVSQQYNVSVNINAMAGLEPMLLFRVSRFYNKDLDFLVGEQAPAYCTSSGKLILSTYTPAQLDEYFSSVRLMNYQEHELSEKSLREELKTIAKCGYAMCKGEYVSGIYSVSFPVRDRNSKVFAFTIIMKKEDSHRILRPEVLLDIRKRLARLE